MIDNSSSITDKILISGASELQTVLGPGVEMAEGGGLLRLGATGQPAQLGRVSSLLCPVATSPVTTTAAQCEMRTVTLRHPGHRPSFVAVVRPVGRRESALPAYPPQKRTLTRTERLLKRAGAGVVIPGRLCSELLGI